MEAVQNDVITFRIRSGLPDHPFGLLGLGKPTDAPPLAPFQGLSLWS